MPTSSNSNRMFRSATTFDRFVGSTASLNGQRTRVDTREPQRERVGRAFRRLPTIAAETGGRAGARPPVHCTSRESAFDSDVREPGENLGGCDGSGAEFCRRHASRTEFRLGGLWRNRTSVAAQLIRLVVDCPTAHGGVSVGDVWIGTVVMDVPRSRWERHDISSERSSAVRRSYAKSRLERSKSARHSLV